MRIKGLTIKNFGKIHDKEIKLSPGINVLYGENESDSEIARTFIKSMLYGITRMRGRAAKNDNYANMNHGRILRFMAVPCGLK